MSKSSRNNDPSALQQFGRIVLGIPYSDTDRRPAPGADLKDPISIPLQPAPAPKTEAKVQPPESVDPRTYPLFRVTQLLSPQYPPQYRASLFRTLSPGEANNAEETIAKELISILKDPKFTTLCPKDLSFLPLWIDSLLTSDPLLKNIHAYEKMTGKAFSDAINSAIELNEPLGKASLKGICLGYERELNKEKQKKLQEKFERDCKVIDGFITRIISKDFQSMIEGKALQIPLNLSDTAVASPGKRRIFDLIEPERNALANLGKDYLTCLKRSFRDGFGEEENATLDTALRAVRKDEDVPVRTQHALIELVNAYERNDFILYEECPLNFGSHSFEGLRCATELYLEKDIQYFSNYYFWKHWSFVLDRVQQ